MAGTGQTSVSDETSPSDHHRDELVDSIDKRLKHPSETSFDCRLLTVPDKLRRTHKEAFLPKQVSIGPFYHQGRRWKAMEDHKWTYLQSFLEGAKKESKECVDFIRRKLKHRAHQCYVEKIDLNDDEFIKMVLVDGAFIIELFLSNNEKKAENDVIFDKQKEWMINDVRRDMSLMENQLPFFVLEDLFNFAFKSRLGELPCLLQLAYDFFSSGVDLIAARPERRSDFNVNSNVKHLLDALRSWYLPAPKNAQGDGWKKVEAIPRASHLQAAGVKFRMRESKCLFDIDFKESEGILHIPCLKLLPATESFLRNITAFEQSYYKQDSYFIDYVAFLGNLINTRADAKLLIKEGIIDIEKWLGHDETLAKDDEALARLFNTFGKESGFWTRNISFCSLRLNLKGYYRSHWHWLKVSMKRHSVSKKKP